ncbi:MAG: hypothetical protein ACC657_04155 [Thiohalomonadales bacterium]
MYRYLAYFFLLSVSGCATTVNTSSPKLSPEVAQNFRQGKISVVFFDVKKTLNYIVEIYEVLNTTERKLSSSYRDDWESDAYLTDLHTRQFAKQGLKVNMFSELFSKADLKLIELFHQQNLRNRKKDPKVKLSLTPEIKEILSERRIKHLVLIDWTGFNLLIKSQGLPAEEFASTHYKIFNVESGNIMWEGSIPARLTLKLKKDGKIFLEENNFAQFKFEVKRLILSQYTRKENNIWQQLGLEEEIEK